MVTENEYINIREILARVTAHPMMRDVTLEQAIRYTVDFMRIVGCPTFFVDKETTVNIDNYRGVLPCDLIAVKQVKDCRTKQCIRSMTDNFLPNEKDGVYAEDTFKIQGRVIITSFRTGECLIAYKAMPVDDDGFPLLLDSPVFLKALELYIKKQVFTVLYDMGKIQTGILTNTQTDYAYAVAQCEKAFIMPSASELQSITNMWNTLIPRMSEFNKGFKILGDKEYLINH